MHRGKAWFVVAVGAVIWATGCGDSGEEPAATVSREAVALRTYTHAVERAVGVHAEQLIIGTTGTVDTAGFEMAGEPTRCRPNAGAVVFDDGEPDAFTCEIKTPVGAGPDEPEWGGEIDVRVDADVVEMPDGATVRLTDVR